MSSRPKITRRRWLQIGAATAASYCLATSASAAKARIGRGKHVIVVGGGLAGLSAADRLRQHDYSVLVLEAGKQVGGRVKSLGDLIPGKTVEAGGELIGQNHPRWIELAKRFELALIPAIDPANAGEIPVVYKGERLASQAAKRILEEFEEIKRVLAKESHGVDPRAPWLHENAQAFDPQSLTDRLARFDGISETTRDVVNEFFGHYNGVPTTRQSLLAMYTALAGGGHEHYWTQTDTLRCRGGAQQLAGKLAMAIGNDNTRLSSAVTGVTVEDRGVTVHLDNERLAADEVILALPPRVLSRLRLVPHIELPAAQIGNAVKHLLITQERSWLPNSSDALLDAGMTWETTANQPGRGHALLLLQSNAAAERLTTARQDERLKLSATALAAAYPALRVEKELLIDWNANPLSRGSYSFPAPGQITQVRGAGSILVAGKIACVGEHLSYAFPGYMEGALESGQSAAEAIVERDR